MTDRSLCLQVRRGDKDAAQTIQDRHAGLVVRVVRQHFPDAGFDDAVQAGRIGLHKAACYYKPNRGPFPNFAGRLIRQAIALEVSERDRRRTGYIPAGMIDRGGGGRRIGKKITPPSKPVPVDGLTATAAAGMSSLALLSPLPRTVCYLLAAGLDPVERLGLYRGELDTIRRQAFAEVA